MNMNAFAIFDLPPIYNINTTELRAKYIKLQQKWHPDMRNGDQNQSEKIGIAYKILRDDVERARCIIECYNHQLPQSTSIQAERWFEWHADAQENAAAMLIEQKAFDDKLKAYELPAQITEFTATYLDLLYISKALNAVKYDEH